MKRTQVFLMLVLTILFLALVRNAKAQRWNWEDEATVAQLRSFDVFLHDHPWIAKKLWEKPARVNDQDFLKDNKEIKQWLEDHPGAAQAFRDDPAGFMERERHFQAYGADFESGDARRGQLARFDWFLESHPDIRRELMRKPERVNNEEYLAHHPELAEFLRRHPGIRTELQEHPREFMEREARFEHKD